MSERPNMSWSWISLPVILLVVNLFWPRNKQLKSAGLVLLILSAWLHGFFDLNPLDRVVGLAERVLTGEQTGTPQQIVTNLRLVQGWAHQTMFQVMLGLSLAVFFAAMPLDILARIRSHLGADLEGREREKFKVKNPMVIASGLMVCVLFVGFTVPATTGPNPDATILWLWVPGCFLIMKVAYFLSRMGRK